MVAVTDVFLFANNKTASLNADLLAGDGSIVLAVGEGAGFPTPTTGQFFAVTLQNTANGDTEICYCTSRVGDILGVERGQEGTIALGFPAAYTTVQMRPTKGILEKFLQVRFTAADVDKYLRIQANGLVYASPANFVVPAGISYLANAETHTAGKGTEEVVITSTAGAASLDPQASNAFYLQLTENVTLTMGTGRTGQVITLAVQQNGTGGYTLAFSGANIQLVNGDAQADANSITHYSARWVDAASVWVVAGLSAFEAV